MKVPKYIIRLSFQTLCCLLLTTGMNARAQSKPATDSLLLRVQRAIDARDTATLRPALETLRNQRPTATEVFSFFKKNQKLIDSLMQPNYARDRQQAAIYQEYFAPAERVDIPLDWAALEKQLTSRYGIAGERAFLQGAFNLNYYLQRYPATIRYGNRIMNTFPEMLNNYLLNKVAWEVFQRYAEPAMLKAALKWSKKTISSEPANGNYLDTYANLLHKLKRTKEAIAAEEKALRTGDANFKKETAAVLEKMKAGRPTW